MATSIRRITILPEDATTGWLRFTVLNLIWTVGIVAGLIMFAAAPQAREPGRFSAYDKYVDGAGNITLPEDFLLNWTFMGTWGVVEEGKIADLHNVYAPKEVIERFRLTGSFDDGAMMIKEVRHARSAPHTTGEAYWVDDVKVWFVMVRDEKNRFPNNPIWGEGWGWGLFKGPDSKTQVGTDYKSDCLHCHVPAQKTDWAYIYAYPVLGADVAKHAPPREEANKGAEVKTAQAKPAEAAAGADSELVARGETVYKRCQACHSLDEGKNGIGPSLWNIFGKPAGSNSKGYSYSDAIKNSGVTWTAESLDRHLADVPGFIPGNRMARLYRGGVKDLDERKAVIEFLRSKAK